MSNFEFNQLFSFEESVVAAAESPLQGNIEAKENPTLEFATAAKLNQALIAAGEAAYHWTIDDDKIQWSEKATDIMGCSLETISSGKRYASAMDAENLTSRFDTVMRTQLTDKGDGVPFRIEYLFKNQAHENGKGIWVEDQGRWYAGADGRPAQVYGTVRAIDDRHKLDQHLNFLGNCDPLTGMMNRGRLTEALGEAISVATREHGNCAFAIAEVNNLSIVNEAYGFEVADEVIVALGRRLREVMRGGDGIARYSGGKFGIILNNCDENELKFALERLLAAVRDSVIETQHGPVWAMLSIGALCLPAQAQDANTATARAEEALNEAVHMRSDSYVIFKPSEARSNERRLNARCATEIVQCLKNDLFKLAFQPIISAQSGEIEMHEALLRMADTQSTELIAAQHLMPVSERLGLVRLIDRAVTQMIINTLRQYPDANLAMNVSATTATDPRWYNQLLEIITANADVAHRLTVEITETVILSDIAATRIFIEKLRLAGCKVAIDDFGAGYTSFRNLRDLKVDIIKLDGSFCHDLKNNSENEYFVRSLIDLGKRFKLKTVAEWIEHESDAEVLREWGVDYMQGHLIGRASVVPPWSQRDNAVFSLAASPMRELEPVVAAESIAEPLASSLEEIALVESPPIETAEIEPWLPDQEEIFAVEPAAEPDNAFASQLDFGGIDESIMSLKQTLDTLRDQFKQQDSERNAA